MDSCLFILYINITEVICKLFPVIQKVFLSDKLCLSWLRKKLIFHFSCRWSWSQPKGLKPEWACICLPSCYLYQCDLGHSRPCYLFKVPISKRKKTELLKHLSQANDPYFRTHSTVFNWTIHYWCVKQLRVRLCKTKWTTSSWKLKNTEHWPVRRQIFQC